jgi:hypothetical protein
MSVDISIVFKDHGENTKTGSFQPTLWLSSAVNTTSKANESVG